MFVTAVKYTEGSFVITESLLPKVIKIAIVNQFHAYRGLLHDDNIVKQILNGINIFGNVWIITTTIVVFEVISWSDKDHS